MTRNLNVLVGDDEKSIRDYLTEALARMGHRVIGVAQTGQELIDSCLALRPDLIITDIRMPGLDGIEAAGVIHRQCPVPVILVSAYLDGRLLQRAVDGHVLAYLSKPIRDHDLESAIAVSMARFRQFLEVSQQAAGYKQALDDRKVIERAKGILMKQNREDEKTAFRSLQKLAMNRNKTLVEIARMVLSVGAAFGLPGK